MPSSGDSQRLQVRGAALTDVGRKRSNNEDQFLLDVERSCFAVADGMGGHAGGEVASGLAMSELRAALTSAPDQAYLKEPSLSCRRELLDWLAKAIDPINRVIQAQAEQDPRLRGMGCTLDVALVRGDGLFLAHVGDSRVYLLRGGALQQLTEDHTLGQMMLSAGVITAEQLAHNPQRNALTRALGPFPTVQVDTAYVDLADGDVVLLCSDGLYNEVPSEKIAAILTRDRAQAPAALIQAALDGGGRDNITAVVFTADAPAPAQKSPAAAEEAPRRRRNTIVLGSAVAHAALAQSPLFAQFTMAELLRVQKIAIGREYAPDALIIEEGKVLSSFFLGVIGHTMATRGGHRIGSTGPGEPFGELSLVPQPALVSVHARTPVVALEFPLAEVQGLFSTEPLISAKLAHAALFRVSKRLRRAVEKLAEYRAAGLIPPLTDEE